tara:strand:+ start:24081 stop:24419 length:339 start_codon:yes stop_codon:yes gene_type:complete
LPQHLHEILHEAAETGRQSTRLIYHVKNDIRQVKALFVRLYGELEHQGIDGVGTPDYRTIEHMREIMRQEAFPLIGQMEIELYGYAQNDCYGSSRHPDANCSLVLSRIRIVH